MSSVGRNIGRVVVVGAIAIVMQTLLVAKEASTVEAPPAPPKAERTGSNLYDQSWVGPLSDGRIIVPTNQILAPAGKQVMIPGRPTDVALSPNRKWLAVLNSRDVTLVDVETGTVSSHVTIRGGGFKGIVFSPDGKQVYASSMKGGILVARVSKDGKLTLGKSIEVPKKRQRHGDSSVPAGLAISADGKALYAALNLKNTLGIFDLASGEMREEIPVGNAPYDVALVGGKAYVSNWAGRLPSGGSPTGPSGGAPAVRVDPVRNIANDGSVSIVDLKAGKEIAQVVVGLHPSALAATPDAKYVVVANA